MSYPQPTAAASPSVVSALPAQPLVLHGTELSGHTHRVVLLLEMLELPYRFVAAPAQVRRSAPFLRLNPLGQIPVLEDGDQIIPDSTAMLVYLVKRYASNSAWLPQDAVGAARVQRWLSIASGELKYGPAAARVSALWGGSDDPVRAANIARHLLTFMDEHLSGREWLAAEHPTIADLALYSYVAHAPEGGIALEPYGAIRQWLARVEGLPRFRPMPRSRVPVSEPASVPAGKLG